MNPEEDQDVPPMSSIMKNCYELASLPIERLIQRMKSFSSSPGDPPFIEDKNNLMIKVFEAALEIKKVMIDIQPETVRIRQMEEAYEKEPKPPRAN